MLVVDGEQQCWAAGTPMVGSQQLGKDDDTRSGSGTFLRGNPLGCSSLAGRGWAIAGFVLGPKLPGPFSKSWWLSPSLRVFQGIYGLVTEITLGIRAVPTPVPHCHVDGDGHL